MRDKERQRKESDSACVATPAILVQGIVILCLSRTCSGLMRIGDVSLFHRTTDPATSSSPSMRTPAAAAWGIAAASTCMAAVALPVALTFAKNSW